MFHLFKRVRVSGGSVRTRHHDDGSTPDSVGEVRRESVVVLFFQRNRDDRCVLEFGKRFVKRIGRHGHCQRMSLIKETAGKDRENVIRTVCRNDLIRRNSMERRDLLAERLGDRIRVQAETVNGFRRQHRFQLRRRRIRIFVGVQLDDLCPLRLFTGNVSGHFCNDRTDGGYVHFL